MHRGLPCVCCSELGLAGPWAGSTRTSCCGACPWGFGGSATTAYTTFSAAVNITYLPLLSPATPVRAVYPTGQTGLACVQLKSKKSGVPGRIVGVSGLPSPENPDLYPVCLSHYKTIVSGQMAEVSGSLPVRPVSHTGQAGPT